MIAFATTRMSCLKTVCTGTTFRSGRTERGKRGFNPCGTHHLRKNRRTFMQYVRYSDPRSEQRRVSRNRCSYAQRLYGATTAMFSVGDAVLLSPSPFHSTTGIFLFDANGKFSLTMSCGGGGFFFSGRLCGLNRNWQKTSSNLPPRYCGRHFQHRRRRRSLTCAHQLVSWNFFLTPGHSSIDCRVSWPR